MNDIAFDPGEVRLTLVDASQGRIGSPLDRLALFTCFQLDPDSGVYVADAFKLMRTAGIVTVLTIVITLVFLALRGPNHADPSSKTLEAHGTLR